MAEEIQLETLAQHRLVDLADPALPGGAGIRDDDVDPAEGRDDLSERIPHRGGVGDVAADAQRRAADRLGFGLRGGLVDIEQRDFGAGRRERLGGGKSDRAGGAGDDGDLARQRRSLALPSFACSSDQYSTSNRSASGSGSKRPTASASVMVAIAASARSAAIFASFLLRPSPNRPTPGTSTTRGDGIEHGLDAADARIVAGEIVLVGLAVGRDGVADRAPESGEIAVRGRGNHERLVLDADNVVGRHHAGLAVAFDLGAVDEIHHRVVAAEIEHEALPGAVAPAVRQAAGAADDRRDLGHRAPGAPAVLR